MATASSKHYPALDGLRGLAILLVLCAHLAPDTIADFGWAGVDLFFVLSGFLITGILMDGKDAPDRAKTFYVRRTLRIFPLYYGTLLLAWALIPLVAPQFFSDVPGHVATWASTFHEIRFEWIYLTNWDQGLLRPHHPGILSHFWSLAVEEQFYLLWPLVIWRCSRETAWRVAWAAIGVSLACRVVLVLHGAPYLTAYTLTPCRLDGLAVGALIAIGVRRLGGIEQTARDICVPALVGAAVVLAIGLLRGSLTNTDPVMETVGFTALAFAFGGLLVVALRFAPTSLTVAPLRMLGRYAYGLYVLHPFVIRGMELHGFDTGDTLFAPVAVVSSLFAAVVSYHAFEAPILSLKDRWAPNAPTVVSADRGMLGQEAKPLALA